MKIRYWKFYKFIIFFDTDSLLPLRFADFLWYFGRRIVSVFICCGLFLLLYVFVLSVQGLNQNCPTSPK